MGKKREIQRNAQARAQSAPTTARAPFSIAITFDPSHPQGANLTVMPLGGDENDGAHIDDVVTALRLSYEQALMQKGAILFQQRLAQAQAQTEASQANG